MVLFVFNYVYTAIDSQQEFMDTYWIMFAASARPQFWFLLLLTPVVCLLPRSVHLFDLSYLFSRSENITSQKLRLASVK